VERKDTTGVKKISGAKRHIAVDTLGLLVAIWHHSASFQDREAVRVLLREAKEEPRCTRILKWIADGGYRGKVLQEMKEELGWEGEIVRKTDPEAGFKVVPKRWIVERTFAWLEQYRRLVKDYERTASSAESNGWIVMTKLLLGKLAKKSA